WRCSQTETRSRGGPCLPTGAAYVGHFVHILDDIDGEAADEGAIVEGRGRISRRHGPSWRCVPARRRQGELFVLARRMSLEDQAAANRQSYYIRRRLGSPP